MTHTTTSGLQRFWKNYRTTLIIVAAVIVASFTSYIFEPGQTTAVLASMVRQSTPLVLGALCGLLGERAGVINIGIEGQMLFSAFIAFLANVYTGNLLVSVLVGMAAGALLGLLHAWTSVSLKVNQIITGAAISVDGGYTAQ